MCQNTPAVIKSSTDMDTRTSNTSTPTTLMSMSIEGTTEDYNLLEEEAEQQQQQQQQPNTTITQKIIYTLLWLFTTYISKEFSKFLCIHQSQAGKQTFIPASYNYSNPDTYFDNTILTYGTDYILCVFMIYASCKCYTLYIPLGYKACALFACYAISVGTGGYAHYTFTSMDSLNTNVFRFWWSCCGKFIIYFFCFSFVLKKC